MIDNDPAIKIECLWGNCPVQGEGTIGGVPFYFRARGDAWSMGIGQDPVGGEADWYYEEDYGEWPGAGWMPQWEALGFMSKAFGLYVESQKEAIPNPTPAG